MTIMIKIDPEKITYGLTILDHTYISTAKNPKEEMEQIGNAPAYGKSRFPRRWILSEHRPPGGLRFRSLDPMGNIHVSAPSTTAPPRQQGRKRRPSGPGNPIRSFTLYL